MARAALLLACLALATPAAMAAGLAPYKDLLFAYPATLAQSADGRYRVLAYDKRRDIHGRDQIAERRVHANYVSLKVRRAQREISAGDLRWFAVGDTQGPAIITLYVHGKGGNRRQGVDDLTFGGNFNRIKNLMVANDGLYLSPDIPGFDAAGARSIAAILSHYHRLSPGAPIFVACGSMGALICYQLARDPQMASMVKGYVLLGAPPDGEIFASPAFRQRTPFFLGHGSQDSVYPITQAEKFFHRFEAHSPGYPVRLYRFETGSHGTPIRMIDWRDTLNWMLEAAGGK